MRDDPRIKTHRHQGEGDGGWLDATSISSRGAYPTTTTTAGGLDAAGVLALGYFETNTEGGQSVISAHGSMGSTETFDPTDGNVHTGTLTADCTVTLNAPTGAGAATLELWLTEQGTHDTTLGTTSRVILETIDGGTNWVAAWIGAGEPTADAHIADTSDAHDASAISVLDTGGYFTGTDVEAALAELAVLVAAAGSGGGASEHAHVAGETHLADGSTVTWTLDNAYEVGSVIAWNTTTIARLVVTEVLPDQATVSAAGSSGDKIVFDYAATLA